MGSLDPPSLVSLERVVTFPLPMPAAVPLEKQRRSKQGGRARRMSRDQSDDAREAGMRGRCSGTQPSCLAKETGAVSMRKHGAVCVPYFSVYKGV